MAVSYPLTLPDAPLRSGYNEKQKENVIRSTVDVGEAKVRRRYTKPIYNESWQMNLTPAQIIAFKSWYNTDLQSGVLRFSFNDPITDTASEYRFLDTPSFTPYGTKGSYRVSFNVERLP